MYFIFLLLFDVVFSTSYAGSIPSYFLDIFLEIQGQERDPLSLVRTIGQLFDMKMSEIRLRKLKLRLRDSALLTTRPPVLSSGSNHFSRSCLSGAVAPRIYIYIYIYYRTESATISQGHVSQSMKLIWGRYFEEMVNFWLSAFFYIVTLCVPHREYARANSGTRAAGWYHCSIPNGWLTIKYFMLLHENLIFNDQLRNMMRTSLLLVICKIDIDYCIH